MKKLSLNKGEKIIKYALRKYSFGVVSVAVSVCFFTEIASASILINENTSIQETYSTNEDLSENITQKEDYVSDELDKNFVEEETSITESIIQDKVIDEKEDEAIEEYAFNETVEELTQSLMPLFAKNGMDWMYANCSTTAQRGALDWMTPFHDAIKPVVEKLYHSVKTGNEAQISIDSNSKPDYREKLEEELKALRESEMWQTAVTVRKLRPENN